VMVSSEAVDWGLAPADEARREARSLPARRGESKIERLITSSSNNTHFRRDNHERALRSGAEAESLTSSWQRDPPHDIDHTILSPIPPAASVIADRRYPDGRADRLEQLRANFESGAFFVPEARSATDGRRLGHRHAPLPNMRTKERAAPRLRGTLQRVGGDVGANSGRNTFSRTPGPARQATSRGVRTG